MPVTIPGVKAVLADGYFSPADERLLNARRILIVAPANPETAEETPGYLAAEPTNGLYNPTKYTSEADVIVDFGLGSPAHVAFSQCQRTGGQNVYISATAPHSELDNLDEVPAEFAALYSKKEYEVVKALENVDLVLPEIIVLHGYSINEYNTDTEVNERLITNAALATNEATITATRHQFDVGQSVVVAGLTGDHAALNGTHTITAVTTNTFKFALTHADIAGGAGGGAGTASVTADGSDRVAKYGEIVATTCAALLADSFPCLGVIAPVGIEEHLTAKGETFVPTRLLATDVNKYVADLSSADPDNGVGVPYPLQVALDAVEAAGSSEGPSLSRFLVIPVGELATVGQPVNSDTGSVQFQTAAPAVAGHIFGTNFKDSITMKRVRNARYIRYRLSKSNLTALIGVKACPVSVDTQLFISTIDGVTGAQDMAGEVSHFTRLQTLTICHEIVRGSRTIAEKYIGKTADENTLNSLETQLRSYYMDLKQMGAARDIRFNIEFIYTAFRLNVNITVVPAGEIREVQLNVGISLR